MMLTGKDNLAIVVFSDNPYRISRLIERPTGTAIVFYDGSKEFVVEDIAKVCEALLNSTTIKTGAIQGISQYLTKANHEG